MIIAGCSNNSDNNGGEIVSGSSVKESISPLEDTNTLRRTVLSYDGISEDDPFIDFFEQYNEDSIFQKSHTKQPYKCIVMQMEGGWDTTIINRKEYSNLLEQEGDYDSYELFIYKMENYYVTRMRGIDNGIYSEYWFKPLDGSFVLEKIEDSSN